MTAELDLTLFGVAAFGMTRLAFLDGNMHREFASRTPIHPIWTIGLMFLKAPNAKRYSSGSNR
jgi:hypothetical protein